MKKVFLVALLCVLSMLMSCGTSQELTSFWVNPQNPPGKPYTSVFIIAIASDRGAQTVVESDLATAAAAEGLKAVRSVDVIIPSLDNQGKPSKEEVFARVKESGCDAVFTVALINSKSEQRYVEGTSVYATGGYGYAPYPAYGHYGTYGSYYGYTVPIATTPGYYTTDKTYFLEGNLYDAETGQIRWSMQSTAYNPSDLRSFSQGYTKLLISQVKEYNAKKAKAK